MADPEAGVPFRKGHGTQNDFVVLPDPDGALELTPARVRALCDRRRGLGADGVLRVVRAAALDEPVAEAAGVEWFMDYRNADGSVAEMCGNGVRVFARYLVEAGLAPAGEWVLGTRGGPKRVWVGGAEEPVTVAMGPVRLGGRSAARVGGRELTGVAVDVGNPHLACVTDVPLAGFDLREPPSHDPTRFPDGVNVELLTAPRDGSVSMRVHERGVGETRSCGTGAVAAAAAALAHAGTAEGALDVHVPGGTVRVELTSAGPGEPPTATLAGPAVLVARGELDPGWWRAATG